MPRTRLTRLTHVPNEPGYAWATVRWLRRQVYEGNLPSHRVGGYVLVDLDDLDQNGKVDIATLNKTTNAVALTLQ